MKRHRQPILLVFFLAIAALPLLAVAVLQTAQAFIKFSREERLESEKLVQVVVPAKQVVWEEEGKELWVGDRMFDVASLTIKDGKYYLTGAYDDKETAVAGSLLHSILHKDGNFLQLLLLLQLYTAVLLIVEFQLACRINLKRVSLYLLSLSSPSYLVLGPPPRQ